MYAKSILLTLLLLFSGIAHGQDIDVTVGIENVSDLIGMSIIIGYNSNAVEVVDSDTTLPGTQVDIEDLAFLNFSKLLAGIQIDKYNNENPGILIIGYSSVPPVFNYGGGNCFIIKFRRISQEDDSIRFIADKCKLESMLFEIPAEWWNEEPPYPSDTTRVIISKIITGIDDIPTQIITTNKLYQNYPNPYNATCIIEFDIKNTTTVELSIYDNLGRKIKTVISEKLNAGHHTVKINTAGMSSGIYFYMIRTDAGFKETKKMILTK